MNIQDIKSEVSTKTGAVITKLNMVRQKDQNTDQPQPWLSHWDNDSRVRVTMHEDVFNQIKANPLMEGLAYKTEKVDATPDRAEYIRFVVITPTSIEGVF